MGKRPAAVDLATWLLWLQVVAGLVISVLVVVFREDLEEAWSPGRSGDSTVQPLDWLCLAPHPDDAEIGTGGTLIRLARSGRAVGVLELSRGERGTQGTPEGREVECVAAAQIMAYSPLTWYAATGKSLPISFASLMMSRY